ncbi:MAG: S9 family peptidase [Phycisphaerales bacterium]
MKRQLSVASVLVAFALTCAGGASADTTPAPTAGAAAAAKGSTGLIPRSVLFGNPDRAGVQISPDGKWVSYLSSVDGVMNVWVAPVDNLDEAKAITKDTKRGIRSYFWAYNSTNILYIQDEGGDENWNVYSTDVASARTTNITPMKGVAAQIEGVSEKFPNEIIVGLNDRDKRLHDLYRVNIQSGERTLVVQNPGTIEGDICAGVSVDDDFRVRFASTNTKEGGSKVYTAQLKKGTTYDWTEFQAIPSEDILTTGPVAFNKDGSQAYMRDSRGRDTSALFSIDLATKKQTLIAENAKADAGGVMTHPTERNVQAVAFNYKRNEWTILDKSIEPDFAYLRTVADGDFNVTSRSLDDKTWIVAYMRDNGPVKFYRYQRGASGTAGKATFLFTNNKRLEGLELARMHPTVIKSRDGLDLVSYLSLPPSSDTDNNARPEKPVPTVLLVHGGPWGRDAWGYNSQHQWLTNRGYAVLAVNFRASTGFGKNFINAGNGEWAGKMHDDLIDAVNWAVSEKIADPKKVAIMGGSYGGYATLAGLTFTPDVFAAGVSIVGPSNLHTLLSTIPAYWEPMINTLIKQIGGDHRTEEGRKYLESRSPLSRVDKIERPLLIGQGANDPRVKQAESDQIVKAMQDKNIPVSYVLFPDEGHGFARPENRKSFNAVAEAFLAKHLGGEYEPIGDDFQNSSITVPAGAEGVPGLPDAMSGKN